MASDKEVKNSDRYRAYIRSPEWKLKRDQRTEIDHHICCVCGRPTTEVHHLTYEHLGNEPMEDLVSLCHDCHMKAGDIADPKKTPLTPYMSNKADIGEDNFMASMRVDAENISQVVFDYLVEARGSDIDSLLSFRQETEKGKKDYWGVLKTAVDALCRQRYSRIDVEDREDIATRMVSNRTIVRVCLAVIEHNDRNLIQKKLGERVNEERKILGTNKAVAQKYNISEQLVSKLRKEDGTSSGPTLRESVLFYCGLDAAAGIKPMEDFSCLTDEDYKFLNGVADYMVGATENEFKKEE